MSHRARHRGRLAIGVVACVAALGCGPLAGPSSPGRERSDAPPASVYRLPRAAALAHVVGEEPGGRCVVVGRYRVAVGRDGAMDVAESFFSGRVVDAVRLDDAWLWRDEGGVVARSRTCASALEPLGELSFPLAPERGLRRGVGRLVARGATGWASSAGSLPTPLEVPARTVEVAFRSASRGLARVEGGLLYTTDDGGRTWAPTSPATVALVGPVSVSGRVFAALDDGRRLELMTSGPARLDDAELPEPSPGVPAEPYVPAIAAAFPELIVDRGPGGAALIDLGVRFVLAGAGVQARARRADDAGLRRLDARGWTGCMNQVVRSAPPQVVRRCRRWTARGDAEVVIDHERADDAETDRLMVAGAAGGPRAIDLGSGVSIRSLLLPAAGEAIVELEREAPGGHAEPTRESLALSIPDGRRLPLCGDAARGEPMPIDDRTALRAWDVAGRTRFAIGPARACGEARSAPDGADELCFTDARRGFAWSAGGAIHVTGDAGRTWTRLGAEAPAGDSPGRRWTVGGTLGCRLSGDAYARWRDGEDRPMPRARVLPPGSPPPAEIEAAAAPGVMHLECRLADGAPSRSLPLAVAVTDTECDASSCAVTLAWAGGGRAPRSARVPLQDPVRDARCGSDVGPAVSVLGLGATGALIGCASASPCGCRRSTMWLEPGRAALALTGPLAGQLPEAAEGGAVWVSQSAAPRRLILPGHTDWHLALDADGAVALVHGLTYSEGTLHGAAHRDGRWTEALAAPDEMSLSLRDVDALEREARVATLATWPTELCADEAEGLDVLVGAELLGAPRVSGPSGLAAGAWTLRFGPSDRCVAALHVGAAGGRATLVAREGVLRGAIRERGAWRELVCRPGGP